MNKEIQSAFICWSKQAMGSANPESFDGFNGPGSCMKYTEPLRKNLVDFFKKHNINSMLDAPCGDASWIMTINFPDGFDYVGADLHPDMIEWLNSRYNKQFIPLDITEDALPSKDVMFVRDVLFHFSNHYKLKFFVNFLKNNFKYLLTSHHPRHTYNIDHGMVGNYFEPINWCIEPWNFMQPIDVIEDFDENDEWFTSFRDNGRPLPYRVMALWSKDQIQKCVNELLHKIYITQ